MKVLNSRLLSIVVGCLAVTLGAPQASADDSEVFTSSSFTAGNGVLPNVLFIIDTSGSMKDPVYLYDGTQSYDGTCQKDQYYWTTENLTDKPPGCPDDHRLNPSANRCRAAYLGITDDGWYRGRMQQLDGSSSKWQNLRTDRPDRLVECEADDKKHGNLAADVEDSGTKKRARNGIQTGADNRWGDDGSGAILDWDGNWNADPLQRYSIYSGNYINWYNNKSLTKSKSRLEIVREVAKKTIDSLDGVNLGLMRYSNNEGGGEKTAEGGMVTFPVVPLTAANKTAIKAKLDEYKPAGNTPLSETLYEAYLYLSGGTVDYGDSSKLDEDTELLSVPESRTGASAGSHTYESPMDFSCQKTFIVYLTDGLPTTDNSASTGSPSKITGLPNFATDGWVPTDKGGGGAEGAADCPKSGPDGSTNGRCLVNLAGYMQKHDFFKSIPGTQNVTTYVVGFGDDIATSYDYLNNVATAGGGKAYTQGDSAGLTAALEEIFSDVKSDANATFVSPTVAVNAFNRTRNLDKLFVTVFAPSTKLHWPGNLKKYQVIDGEIFGADKAVPAVGSSGFFAPGVTDMFNSGNQVEGKPDGADVTKGGAASRLPKSSDSLRKVYTYLKKSDNLTDDSNQVVDTNDDLTPLMLGLPADAPSTTKTRLVKFIRGLDTTKNAASTTPRYEMGDPMRTRPAVVIYGGTEDAPEGVVFVTTNDGQLHAIDMNSGEEDWAFIPPEFLSRQAPLFDNATSQRTYAIDGDVRVFKYDVNGDGLVNDEDRVYAVFGFGRGGSTYYALDITAREKPKFLWMNNNDNLTALGQAWSPPVFARVNVGGTAQSDKQRVVMIIGGGYDKSQDNYDYVDDGVGNAIYMLELNTGKLLWSAGKTGSGANWTSDKMTSSIPSEITVLDMDGDGYADRMYTGDMGGRIWRFDIWHGEEPDKLVSGGVFATLGVGHLAAADRKAVDTRRFYYAPDVALVAPRGSAPYMNIAIGSGYRGHPLDTETHDRFYALRDYQPFNRRLNSSYASPGWTPIADTAADKTVGKLANVTADVNTAVIDGAAGWRLDMATDGEKVLASSVTAGGVIFFPSFTPHGVDSKNPCLAQTLNRTYAVYLDSAKPYGLRDGEKPGDPPSVDSPSDRYTELAQGGIAPGMAIIQTPDNRTLCLAGVEAIGRCINLGDVVRTYWERRK
jgi:type IV pilus assembly protein PilY1